MANTINNELVSVIIPSYNHARYIKNSLDSVALQTYKNIEIVVIDDMSSDSSYSIIKKWKNLNTGRFKSIIIEKNKKNLGAHATINKGLDLASGEWLTILNSDDCYTNNRIEKLLLHSHESHADLVFSGIRVIDDEGKRHQSKFAAKIESLIELAGMFPDISFALLEQNIAATTGNLFFSRKLFEKVGYFRELRYVHDWDFLLRGARHFTISHVAESLYEYRIHGTNSFHSLQFEKFLEPQVILRNFFYDSRAKNFSNYKHISQYCWENIYDQHIIDSSILSWSDKIIGKNTFDYNSFITLFWR